MVAEVEHPVRHRTVGRMREGAKDTGHDVGDMCEIALHAAFVEHIDRPPGQHRAREQQRRHVRPAPRPIHGEEAQAGGVQAVQLRVGVGHQLVGGLGRRVQRTRLVHALVFGERRRGRVAIDRAARRIHQVLHATVAAQFEHVDEADQVAVDVGVRVFQRIAHAGLRGQVDHRGRLHLVEQRGQAVAVGQVERAQVQRRAQRGHAVALDLRIVVVVEVVQADHRLARLQQRAGGVGTDEAGSAGEQDGHCSCLEIQ
ncbi:hypothetical protein G6F57_013883 [Rhizopus arrhizus]|nr:hypothetical protein G6F57_013883 [Rhizopus arrhizus]